MSGKNPHAVALGRRGGRANRDRMTPAERSASASKAAKAKWAGLDERGRREAVRAANTARRRQPKKEQTT